MMNNVWLLHSPPCSYYIAPDGARYVENVLHKGILYLYDRMRTRVQDSPCIYFCQVSLFVIAFIIRY